MDTLECPASVRQVRGPFPLVPPRWSRRNRSARVGLAAGTAAADPASIATEWAPDPTLPVRRNRGGRELSVPAALAPASDRWALVGAVAPGQWPASRGTRGTGPASSGTRLCEVADSVSASAGWMGSHRRGRVEAARSGPVRGAAEPAGSHDRPGGGSRGHVAAGATAVADHQLPVATLDPPLSSSVMQDDHPDGSRDAAADDGVIGVNRSHGTVATAAAAATSAADRAMPRPVPRVRRATGEVPTHPLPRS
jgi:hypothetical protein